MIALADLLALWTCLADVAAAPADVHLVRPDAAGGVLDGHWPHPVPTLVTCLRGTVRVELARDRRIDLAPGCTLLIAAGTAHRHAPVRAGSACFELGFDQRGADLDLTLGGGGVFTALIPEQPARRLCEALISRLRRGESADPGPLLRLPLDLPLVEAQRLPPPVERMREALMRRGLHGLDARSLVAAGRLGPSRGWQVFREHLGCSPRQAIERRRVRIAAGLLTGGATVADAATRCGFRDRGTFTRACRRVLGRTPAELRLNPGA